jgi:hypothetical protein
MLKFALPLATGLMLAGAVPPSPSHAAGASLSCQTTNGWTICVRGSGANATASLSCRTVNGRTTCSGTGGLRCEAAGGRPVCRGGAGIEVEIRPANPRTGSLPPLDELWQDDDD